MIRAEKIIHHRDTETQGKPSSLAVGRVGISGFPSGCCLFGERTWDAAIVAKIDSLGWSSGSVRIAVVRGRAAEVGFSAKEFEVEAP